MNASARIQFKPNKPIKPNIPRTGSVVNMNASLKTPIRKFKVEKILPLKKFRSEDVKNSQIKSRFRRLL